jgi:serpin B
MYLVNAIYFNGTWKTAFEPSQTSSANFYLSGGGVESVPFMHQQLTARIAVDSTQTLLELPYGSGGSFAMYIALPADTGQSIGEFASLMNAGLLSAAINKMDSQQVDIALPKWSYSYAIDDMQPALSALGMGIAFGQAADFSNMYSPSQVTPYISKAVHKAYISVDEQGTTAAAATVIGMSFTSVAGVLPFNANHPFLYTIVEKQTGTILFIGIVNDPSLDGN